MRYLAFLFLLVPSSIVGLSENKKCSCVPLTLTFQLNTTSGCTEAIDKGAKTGISDSFCLIREAKFQKDIVPVTIDTIKIFELKGDLTTLGYPTVVKGLSNGDTLEFTFSNQTNTSLAGGIQFMIKGVNKNGDSVTQDSIVTFTNNCSSLVFNKEDEIGFLTVVDLGQPSSDTCPIVPVNSTSNVSLSDSYNGGCKYGSGGKGCNGSSNGHGNGGNSGCKNGHCGGTHYGSWSNEFFRSVSYSYSLSYSHSYRNKPKVKLPRKIAKAVVNSVIVKRVVPKTSTGNTDKQPLVLPPIESTVSKSVEKIGVPPLGKETPMKPGP